MASRQTVPCSRDAAALDERAAGCSCSGRATRPQGRKVRNLQMTPWYHCLMRVSCTHMQHNLVASQQLAARGKCSTKTSDMRAATAHAAHLNI